MVGAAGEVMLVAGGHRLKARWFAGAGRPGRPAIVLLHQGLGSLTQWRGFPERLAAAAGAAVVGYDRWGHGGSEPLGGPRSPDFLAEEAERTLPEVLDRLGLADAVIYGHSDGGTIALLFAAAHPGRVRALVSESAHVFAEAHSAQGFADTIAAFETGDLRARLARHHGASVDTMFRGWADVWRSPAMRDWRITGRLAAIRSPVLVIQGERDDHCLPAQAEEIARGVGGPSELWIVPGAGHAAHLEATEAVAARVAAFVDRILPLSGA
jgi:pimeloyl-ACP methyl ester carboxylesterase